MTETEYENVLQKYDLIRDEIVKNTVKEQEHYIITYTRIITDIPGFRKDLETYEIYNGRTTLPELKKIIFSGFKNFIGMWYLMLIKYIINSLMGNNMD